MARAIELNGLAKALGTSSRSMPSAPKRSRAGWMLAVEQIVIPAFPAVGRRMPGGATLALLQLGPAAGSDGKQLSAASGALLLVGYTASAVALALLITPWRDVL